MARMYTTLGACPSCGRDCARTVHTFHGLQSEVYHCPEEGRIGTSIEQVALGEWASVPVSLSGLYA